MCFKIVKKTVALPHPKEIPVYGRDYDKDWLAAAMTEWLGLWEVIDPDFWMDDVYIHQDVSVFYPAWASAEYKEIGIRPEWCNPGTIAHEVAHISYGLLTDKQKQAFSDTYIPLKDKGWIKELYKQNTYGLSNVIEGHAEVYRYIGQCMPEVLKQFYPKLL